jgi:hypothetical protein
MWTKLSGALKNSKIDSYSGCTGSPSTTKPSVLGFSSKIGNVMGYLWNGPNTALGVAYGLIGIPTQGIRWEHGQLQFKGHLLQRFLSGNRGAITIGDAGIYPAGFGPETIRDLATGQTLGLEESYHSSQGRILGPLYLPANLLGGILGLIHGGSWHDPANFMERGPHSIPPRRF